ncbi:MAG: FlgD immunoglobulin-like domain containing protein [Candidatus Eisenbacteria bacterium]
MRRTKRLPLPLPRQGGFFFLLAMTMAMTAASPALAKRGVGQGPAVERNIPRAERLLAAERAGEWTVRRDGTSGRVSRVEPATARAGAAKGESPAERTLGFARELAPLLGIEGVLDELEVAFVRRGLASEHVVLRRVAGGVPVEPGRLGAHFDKSGRLLYADVTLDPRPVSASKSAAVAASAAEAIAAEGLVPGGEARTELVWRETGEGIRLAWRVDVSSEEPAGLWTSFVDASSGEILERANRSPHATGSGRVWTPNPVNVLETTNLSDMNDTDQGVFDPAYRIVTLQGLSESGAPAQYRLEGPYVEIVDFETPTVPPPVAGNPDGFRFYRADDRFEAVMAYYHIDECQRYLRDLGFDGVAADSIVVSPIPVDVHGFQGQDNSRYDPFPLHRLSFGDGCVDDAEEADVLIHEYGHAIEFGQAPDWGYPGGYMGAMAEGFSDYWSESHAARRGVTFDLGQVFDWDRGPVDFCWLGRRVDNAKTMDDLRPLTSGNIYDNSQIWSGSLWDLHGAVGGPYADSLILESHFYYNGAAPSVSFADGAFAIIEADRTFTGGAHGEEIFNVFKARGVLTGDDTSEPTILSGSHPPFLFAGEVFLCSLTLRSEVPIRAVEIVYGVTEAAGDTADLATGGDSLWVGSVTPPPESDSLLYSYMVTDLFDRTVLLPDPGRFLSVIVADVQAPNITHAPAADALDSALPVPLSVTATDNSAVDPDSVIVYWSFDGAAGSDSGDFALSAGAGDSVFTGPFPEGPGRIGTYEYRILAVDVSAARNRSYEPPSGFHSFSVFADTTAPALTHTPLPDVKEGEGLPEVRTTITDDGALDGDSLYVEYLFTGAEGGEGAGKMTLAARGDDEYAATFPEFSEEIGSVEYRIVAVDAALAANRTVSPAAGYHEFEIYPSSVRLALRGPNPFAERVAFTLYLSKDANVLFEIYDLAGRRIHGEEVALTRGAGHFEWNGRNSDDRRVAPGIYLYRVAADGYEKTGRIVHLR